MNTNFEQAYQLCEQEFTHSELLEMLTNGNIAEKQIAALKFDDASSKEDVAALLNNLTGCDGKIREAVALKINKILVQNENIREIFASLSPKIFADATIDINANICRLVVDSVEFLKNYNNFSQKYLNYILQFTNEAFEELDKFIFRDKKYVINKQLFKLYWCLETLKNFCEMLPDNILHEILTHSLSQNEYTIREKVAEIVVQTNKFEDIKEKLINDNNYYVRSVFKK